MPRCTSLITALGLLGLAACVENADESVVILRNTIPETGCVVDGSGDSFRGAGIIEVGSAQGYVFTPLVQNFSVVNNDDELQRIAFIQGATVDIRFADPNLFDDATESQFRSEGLTHFRAPFAASVEPGGTATMLFEIVPEPLLDELESVLPDSDPNSSVLLLITIRVDGTIGSGDFESPAYEYSVEVCRGCLINDLGACSALASSFVPTNLGNACNAVQDATVDCCSEDGSFVCPAVGTAGATAQ